MQVGAASGNRKQTILFCSGQICVEMSEYKINSLLEKFINTIIISL